MVDAIDRATGFLDGNDVAAVVGKADRCFHIDLDDAAAGDRVEHDRKAGLVGDRFEMLVEAFLGGLVVVGADLEGAIGTEALGFFGEMDGFAGGVCSGAGEDFHAACAELDGVFDDFEVLVGGEGGGFSSGSDGHDAINAGIGLAINEGAEGLDVEVSVAERSDEGGIGPCEHGGGCRVNLRDWEGGMVGERLGQRDGCWSLSRRACPLEPRH